MTRDRAAVRVYFHLRRGHEVMPDDQGVDVSGPDEARVQALQVIDELRQKDARYWLGWSLVAVDDAGDTLFTLDLGSFVGRLGLLLLCQGSELRQHFPHMLSDPFAIALAI